ncbi:enoyl-CoA hydratase [Phreatobacter stygius]|uniref:Enoyl-CoA hydratase n=1 Tax=Phreatobacter stygius TaxID=1940610 RepID=A0A4D7BB76_9HYPH|nr:enoyl-CoA hydratase-related protein [Phreatobacter stygius]QCI68015.1 enoyl-CoA hydratase [Phreatobacter stygius]
MAGADLGTIQADPDRAQATIGTGIEAFHDIVRCIRRMAQPVIAGVNGAAAGGGLGLALACDFVVAAADASFVPAYTRIGTSPDGGTTWSVAHILGQRRALEWIMLGDPMNAEAALAAGLINRVVPVDGLAAEVDALACRIAAGPAFAFATVKRLVHQAPTVSFEMQLDAERDGFIAAAAMADFREGIAAFFERRPARFGK